MEKSILVESIRYSAVCQGCGVEAEWCGVQALVGETLRWDVESTCSTCGFAVAVCGGDLPEEMRSRLLSEHGRARLRVNGPASNATVMRVLRAELGIGLDGVKAVLEQVLSGQYSGTLPEMELLARKLRVSGIDAVASRAGD
jgi:MinD superfamily P-loop ATPase